MIEDMQNYPTNYKLPNDKTRAKFAHDMMFYAVLHLVLHELGHVILGHLNYKETWRDTNTHEEVPKHIPVFELQAMEFDADAFAINAGGALFISPQEVMTVEQRATLGIPSDEYLPGAWLFASSSILNLLSLVYYNEEKLNRSTHPTSGMRISRIAAELEGSLISSRISTKEINIYSKEKSNEIIIKEVHEILIFWLKESVISMSALINNKEIGQLLMDSAKFDIDQMAHLKKVVASLQKIQNELRPLALKLKA